ncbi:hypothetical protein LCGC14_1941830, partial [marine sediment metagenome]
MSGPRCFADYYTAMEQGFPIFSYSNPSSLIHLAYFFFAKYSGTSPLV